MTIWLIRHGESSGNAGLPATRYGDVPLTELGRRQAEHLAGALDCKPDLVMVSSFLRAQAMAAPLLVRWPELRVETWPIEEFTYLSPARCIGSTIEGRRAWAGDYWRRSDPDWRDADDAETFTEFTARLWAFAATLKGWEGRFVAAFGHGQFFRAYLRGLTCGFEPSAGWMRSFRAEETGDPLVNAERVVIEDRGLVYRVPPALDA